MARPIKEGMDYFPHDTDASSDEKIELLTGIYGNDGYAFYFIMLERIYRNKDFCIDVSDAETEEGIKTETQQSKEKESKEKESKEKESKEKEIIDKLGGSCSGDFNIYQYMQQRGFIVISPIMAEQVKTDIELYSLEEVKQAIDIADNNGKHTYSYVKGILEKRRAGYDELLEMKQRMERGEDPF